MGTYRDREEHAKTMLPKYMRSKRFAHKRIVAELRAKMQITKAAKMHLAGLSELKLAAYYRLRGDKSACRIQIAWSRRFRELSQWAGGFLPRSQ